HEPKAKKKRDGRDGVARTPAAQQAADIAECGEREQRNQPVDRLPGDEPADEVFAHESGPVTGVASPAMAAKRVCRTNAVILAFATLTVRSMRPRPRRFTTSRKRAQAVASSGATRATISPCSGRR